MKRHNHLLEQVCSFENLHAAAKKALKGKRGKRPGSSFFAKMEEEIIALQNELLSGIYRHGEYNYFLIYEPKKRTVAISIFWRFGKSF